MENDTSICGGVQTVYATRNNAHHTHTYVHTLYS